MEQRNLVLAIVLSVAILLTFQVFILEPPLPPEQQAETGSQTQQQQSTAPSAGLSSGITPGTPSVPGMPATTTDSAVKSRAEVLSETRRVQIDSPTLQGSISLTGGHIDDLVMKNYHETIDVNSERIVLLSPIGTEQPYFADFAWTGSKVKLPGNDTEWQANAEVLSPERPVTLNWDNGEGLRFELVYELDQNYMLTVTQRVFNSSTAPVTLSPYGLISRTGTPSVLGFYILHEGLLGVFDGTLQEVDYSDLQEDGVMQNTSTGGWLGITDKYWQVALVPDQSKPVEARFLYDAQSGVDKYQADFLYEGTTIPAGGSAESTSRLFAGAKVVALLDHYRDDMGVVNFDLSVDFGWFYFLTKPLFYAIHHINQVVGNFGVAILILTVGIKLLFFPLANKSYTAMAKMRKLQPEMLELRERFKEDKQRLNQEMMALYKREGANPASGCLPIIVQIPVFFALYKVMFVTIEMRHAPFFGWIQDLSAPDPSSILNLFGLMPWGVPDLGGFEILNLGVWPLAMGISMFLQMRLNPQPPDPIQAKIFAFMPIMFTFLLAQFPAGLVVYWTWNNVLSMAQQYVIMKRAGVPIGRKAGTS